MSPEELLKTLRATLEAERSAIRSLDVEAIEQANDIKESVLACLKNLAPPDRGELYRVLAEVQPELHYNLTLLAHAQALIAGERASSTSKSGMWRRVAPPCSDSMMPPTVRLPGPPKLA